MDGDTITRPRPAASTAAAAASRPAPELTVVVPCFNEAGNVPAMVQRLDRTLAGIAWEVVFVDDDSPDGTAAVARRIASADARVRCVRRIGRRGLASACVEGALSSSADLVAVIDGDLQHDETLLPRMAALLRDDAADIVVGSRHAAGGDAAGGLSPIRRAVSDLGGAMSRAVLPVPVADPMSGFFMMPRPLFEAIAPRLTATGFKILLDLLVSAGRKLRVRELPYRFRARQHGESKLDALVLLEFAGLLLDKALGGLLPLRFVAFAAVGAAGVVVHLAVLGALHRLLLMPFDLSQGLATLAAMTANFLLNNRITYRHEKLRGPRLLRGLLLFYVVCGFGAAANLGVASLLLRDGVLAWGAAGAVGAIMTVVWNYAVSSTLVWRAR
jgi:dolichol-phosphate mannosyltransferase